MLNRAVILLSLLILTGCGGDGGGAAVSPTDPDQSFSLSITANYPIQLTGSDSNGVSYVGSISRAVRGQEMLGGVLVTVTESIFSITGGGVSTNSISTSYSDTDGNRIASVSGGGVTCTAVSPDSLPESGKIGDFGTLSPCVCDDNTTDQSNWRIEDAGNGIIALIIHTTSRDQSDSILFTRDTTYTLDVDGNRLSYGLELYYDNYSLSLKSI